MRVFAKIISIPLILLVMIALQAAHAAAEERSYTLQDAYDASLLSHETVKISEETSVQADNRVDQAWTYLYPRITASGSYTHYSKVLPPGGGAFIFQPEDQVLGTVVLTQPLYTGGRTLAALRAAKTMQQASKSDLSTTRQDLLLNVAQAYYSVIRAEKVVDASKDSLERMIRHKQVTEREAATRRNKANASALLRADTLVSQARIILVRAEDGVKTARQKLSLLTRFPEDARLMDPEPLPVVEFPLSELQEAAIQNRTDLKSTQLQTEFAKELVTVTRGSHYPQVYLEGGVRYQDSDPQTGLDATVYYGGLNIQIPLFEGGLMKYEVAEARSKMRQSEYASELLRRTILSQVEEAYINYRSSTTILSTVTTQYDYARRNFDTIEGLFAEGLVSSLSLIDAQQALFLAEQERINAWYDQQVAILHLQRSEGLLVPRTEQPQGS